WLEINQSANSENSKKQVCVFFNGHDNLKVQLDQCFMFLDEVYIRGTDLKLPIYYRATVTLGAGLTKNRFVQEAIPKSQHRSELATSSTGLYLKSALILNAVSPFGKYRANGLLIKNTFGRAILAQLGNGRRHFLRMRLGILTACTGRATVLQLRVARST
ncbi:hypothetical protein PoMZ_01718, partial [Pyricularia oryzae]